MTMSIKTLTRANADQVGEMLWRANREQTEEWADPADRILPEMPSYAFEELPGTPDPVVVLNAISCYRYQTAGDPEDFEPSEVCGFLEWLTAAAVQQLPGMASAPWLIEDRNVFLTT